MCNSGNNPAQATANSVIASANRLIEVRHSCFNSRRIAEINVPAWPMPTHQTKLMIAKPHITGALMPQMPTPSAKSWNTATPRSSTNDEPMPMPTAHRQLYGRSSTSELILDVTDP